MNRRGCLFCTVVLALVGCGSNGAPIVPGSNTAPVTPAPAAQTSAGTISGSVNGKAWTDLAHATWIGKPSTGSPPVILFLFESAIDCPILKSPNWDKTALGNAQLLEIELAAQLTQTFQVAVDADVAYLKGAFNPDADGGTVTIDAIHASQDITGSFDVKFAGETLKGSFDAQYCFDGVEP